MKPTEPLPLNHSWPLFEWDARFGAEAGPSCSALSGVFAPPLNDLALSRRGIGTWQCDLSNNSLTWSPEVYDIFGLPRGARISRDEAVALYCEDARAAMECLRAYTIKHRRGFTMDAEIRPVHGGRRWMRLTAAPICDGGRVVGLHGLKQDVSTEYR